jgi:hypothetical protein
MAAGYFAWAGDRAGKHSSPHLQINRQMVLIQPATWVELKDCRQERPLTQRLLEMDRDPWGRWDCHPMKTEG